jgi:acyl-CoA thioesterase
MEAIKQFFSANDLFARHNGIEIVEVGEGEALVSMNIQPYHFNGAGTVHGGAIFTLADFAFAIASNSHGQLAMGISTSMNFVKAPVSGTLYARASEQSRNAKLAAYSVTVTDDDGSTIAIFQGMVYRKKESILSLHVDNQSNVG